MRNKYFKNFQMPHTYVIIFGVILLAALLTLFIPLGQYGTQEITYVQNGVEKTKTVLDPDSFHYILDAEGNKITRAAPLFGTEDFGGQGVLNYMFEGLTSGDKSGSAVGIVAFILVIGGAFGIVLKTGAIDQGILAMIQKTHGSEAFLIPILFILFSLGGAVFGMGEEAIPFAMILVPMFIAMGYDAIVGICVTYVATQIGFGSSWMNPFSLAIAQGIAEVPVMSGSGLRIAFWILFTIIGVTFTMVYAKKIKKNPRLSVAYESDAYYREEFQAKGHNKSDFKLGHKLIILVIALTMAWTVWGVTVKGFYIPEIASQFFVMGLISGIIGVIFKLNQMKVNDIASAFQNGAADLIGAALVVGMAQGIIIVLGGANSTEPTVLNTILHSISNAMHGLPAAVSAWLMYIFQTVFNFFVVSGSGQAALTMPIMAPLSDLLGVTRQVSVLAFQFGDAFSNIFVPTSGCLLGVLGVAKLDWGRWAKFQIKMQAVLFVLSSAAILFAVAIGFQ